MKKIASIFLSLCFAIAPCFAVTAMHGHASNFTIQPAINYTCFPFDENGDAAPIPYTCTGSATVIQSTTTFTSLTAILSRPIVGSHSLAIQPEDFTTGNNIGNSCIINTTQMACSITFTAASTVSAGDVVALKVWDNTATSGSYNVEHLTWVLQ